MNSTQCEEVFLGPQCFNYVVKDNRPHPGILQEALIPQIGEEGLAPELKKNRNCAFQPVAIRVVRRPVGRD